MRRIKIVEIFKTNSSKEPFKEWFDDLEITNKTIVLNRLDRVIETCNFGDCKLIAGAKKLWELRIHHGPGYRIYFGLVNLQHIIILFGGKKSSQSRDINRAIKYWQSYLKEHS